MTALRRAQSDIGQAREVQFENAEVERLFDQLHGLLGEVLFITYEGNDHPDGQTIAQRKLGGEINRDDVLQAEQGVIEPCERDFCAPESDIGAHYVGISVEPL